MKCSHATFAGLMLGAVAAAHAAPVVTSAFGDSPALIQGSVDAFRSSLGALNPNMAGSFAGGRREINWDGVPDNFSAPNAFPANFFNSNSPRGVVFSTPGSSLQVSADDSNPTATPTQFGNIDPSYPGFFEPFSPQRLFTAIGSNIVDVSFFVPGSAEAALTSGFGVIFSDVDVANLTSISFFDATNTLLRTDFAPFLVGIQTFSFLGVDFDSAIVARVRITSGNQVLAAGNGAMDLVVMDDFIYGEPVSTDGLVISPASGVLFQAPGFQLVIGLSAATPPLDARLTFDGADATQSLVACFTPGALKRGGTTFSCPIPRGALTEGDHVLQVVVTDANQTRRRTAVRWTVLGGS